MKTIKLLIVIALWSVSICVSAQNTSPWLLGGNAISSTPTSTPAVFGTTTDNPIEIKTSDIMRMYISSGLDETDGFIGVNTDMPKQMFHVVGGNILISRTSERTNKALGSTNGSILFGDETSSQYPYGSWGIEYVNNDTEGHGLNFWKTWGQSSGINNVIFLCEEKNYKGYVGIGTNLPKQKLHVVDGNILISRTSDKADGSINGSIMFGSSASSSQTRGDWAIEYVNDANIGFGLNFWKPWSESNGAGFNYALFLKDNGNVGIGTKDPFYKLSVNGTILAKEIRVNEDSSYWPDFVFDKDYDLMSLAEVKQFVSNNRHLPCVPSAADVDGKDVSLGEMNRILLQKIEELTLYVIDLQEQIDALKTDAGKE